MKTAESKASKSALPQLLLALVALVALVMGWAIIAQYRVHTAGLAQ